jgi:hypothetical protein
MVEDSTPAQRLLQRIRAAWACAHSATPAGVDYLARLDSGGVRAATSFATTPASREALDHRLFSSTASGVGFAPL